MLRLLPDVREAASLVFPLPRFKNSNRIVRYDPMLPLGRANGWEQRQSPAESTRREC